MTLCEYLFLQVGELYDVTTISTSCVFHHTQKRRKTTPRRFSSFGEVSTPTSTVVVGILSSSPPPPSCSSYSLPSPLSHLCQTSHESGTVSDSFSSASVCECQESMKSRKCPCCLFACVMILHMSRTVGQGHEFLCEAGMTSDDEESASNVLALSMRVSTIHFLGGTVVQVAESVVPTSHRGSTNDDTGLMVWGPALALSQFLEHNPQLVQGKQVMELGCGTALPSIMARRLGAIEVVATDFRLRTLQHVKSNADLNKCVIHTEVLDWEHPAIFYEYAPDIMIASDVLYASSMAPILQKAIEKILPRNSTFVLATKDGRSGIQDFREAMSKHFDEIQLLTSVNQSYIPQIPESISSDLLSSERWQGTFSIFQYWWS